MFDEGSGKALVVIPGVQGRWEWMRPALDALSRRCRVISFSLGRAATFEALLAQVDAALDGCGLVAAAICGVSFGGTVAAHYAATRPARTTALIVVSAPGPSWTPSDEQARHMASPWRSTPAFLLSSAGRLWPEIAAAIPDPLRRLRFVAAHTLRIAMAPIVPAGMAARIRLRPPGDARAALAGVAAPALIVSGEPGLDRVVPVEATREFAALIPGAKYEMMEGTGHIGLITQPERFARTVGTFVNAANP